MPLRTLVEALGEVYTGFAFALVIFSGLLTIMVERYLYRRGGYKNEAAISAAIGWTYVLGGTLFYLTLWVLRQFI